MNDAAIDAVALGKSADEAAEFLKLLSNPARLRILCALLLEEQCVGDLETLLGASQSYVSGQLARMRSEGLVIGEREGRTIRYRLSDERLRPLLERLYEVFCMPEDEQAPV